MAGKKGRSGRPRWQPTDEQRELVKFKAAAGIPHESIAAGLGISVDTLTLRCPYELKFGKDDANASMAGTLYKAGKDGNVQAMIFWLKTRARWRETANRLEVTGKDGGPIQTEDANARDQILSRIAGISDRATAGGSGRRDH